MGPRSKKTSDISIVLGYLLTAGRYSELKVQNRSMKVRVQNETSFSAKMVLLFALVFLATPGSRRSLEFYIKVILKADTSAMGQIPSTRLGSQHHFQSTFNR